MQSVSAIVDVRSHASDCSGGTPPFSFRLSSLSRLTRSRFPLPSARNPETVDKNMPWFEGRKEEHGEALRFLPDPNVGILSSSARCLRGVC